MDDIELTVDQVKHLQCDFAYLSQTMPEVAAFVERFHVAELCRDWLRLRARGAGVPPADSEVSHA